MSVGSVSRQLYKCDAASPASSDLRLVTNDAKANRTHSVLTDGSWEDLDVRALSNANDGQYVIRTSSEEAAKAGDPLAVHSARALSSVWHPYLDENWYANAWGLEYQRDCVMEDAAEQVYPTAGSCYANQPPYWVEECHYGNVRSCWLHSNVYRGVVLA